MIRPTSKIFIQKAPKPKDAVRIRSAEDIPDFLRGTISIEGEEMVMHNAEGSNQRAPLGMVCGFEKSEATSSGYGMWPISDESRLIERDGKFFAKPTPTPACPIGPEPPEWMSGAEIRHNRDGSFTMKTDWGESTGRPGEAYWVLYGVKADGRPDANILTISERSFSDYFLCTEDGQNICTLAEFDARFKELEDQGLNITPEACAAMIQGERARGRGVEASQDAKTEARLAGLKGIDPTPSDTQDDGSFNF